MTSQRWMWIVWPAFLAAGVLEMLVFASFNPQDVLWLSGGEQLSQTMVYTVAFFVFWAVLCVAGYLMVLLSKPPAEVNHPSATP